MLTISPVLNITSLWHIYFRARCMIHHLSNTCDGPDMPGRGTCTLDGIANVHISSCDITFLPYSPSVMLIA